MASITYVHADGTRRTVPAEPGDSVMLTAVAHGVDGIVAECGGHMMCATCHVYVDETCLDALPAADEVERETLEGAASEIRRNSRLGCQVVLPEGLEELVVHLPETQV